MALHQTLSQKQNDVLDQVKIKMAGHIFNGVQPEEDEEVEAWMYTIGPALLQYSGVFEMVPKQDWLSEECLNLRK